MLHNTSYNTKKHKCNFFVRYNWYYVKYAVYSDETANAKFLNVITKIRTS